MEHTSHADAWWHFLLILTENDLNCKLLGKYILQYKLLSNIDNVTTFMHQIPDHDHDKMVATWNVMERSLDLTNSVVGMDLSRQRKNEDTTNVNKNVFANSYQFVLWKMPILPSYQINHHIANGHLPRGSQWILKKGKRHKAYFATNSPVHKGKHHESPPRSYSHTWQPAWTVVMKFP